MGDWIYALTQRGRQECAGVTSSVPPALRELLRLVDGKRTRDEVLAATGKSAVSAGGLIWWASSGYIERVLQPWPAAAKRAADTGVKPSSAKPTKARATAPAPVQPPPAARPVERTADVAVRKASPPPAPPHSPPAAAPQRPPAPMASVASVASVPTVEPARRVTPPVAAPVAPPVASRPPRPAPAARAEPSAGHAPSPRPTPQRSAAPPDLKAALTAFMSDAIRQHLSDDADEYLYQVRRAASVGELIPMLNPLIDAVLEAAGPGAAAEFADGAAEILEP